jgi:hypothetical protein
MLVQAHLLRFPIWQGRWPANRSASVGFGFLAIMHARWDAEEPAATWEQGAM